MVLICNTGPLIALAKLDRLALLGSLGFQHVVIPPGVQRELLAKVGPESVAIDAALTSILAVEQTPDADADLQALVADLDLGEREVLLLATDYGEEVLLLLDDRAARRVARTLDYRVTGSEYQQTSPLRDNP